MTQVQADAKLKWIIQQMQKDVTRRLEAVQMAQKAEWTRKVGLNGMPFILRQAPQSQQAGGHNGRS